MEINWDRVGHGLYSGTYNLLLGSGVSLDSFSSSKNPALSGNLPSTGELCENLISLKPGLKKGSSLNRVYRTLTKEEIKNNITEQFSNTIPGNTVKKLSEFKWRRIFTLNIDDALEGAYNINPLSPQTPKVVNYNSEYIDYQDKLKVPIIHLHGYAASPEDGYIFDIRQYMKNIRENNLWGHILGNIIRTEPFFVIGTTLDEPDITYFLADRDKYTVRSDRPPSILVDPSPDSGTHIDCEDFLLKLYEGTALDFLNDIDNRFPDRPTVLDLITDNLQDIANKIHDPSILSVFHSDFERVPLAQTIQIDFSPNFALGHTATWSDMIGSRDISRDQTSLIRKNSGKLSPREIYLLLGKAGSGKSVILRRLALEFAENGYFCFWCRSVGRIRVEPAIECLKTVEGPVVIFIDNFADHAQQIGEIKQALTGNVIFLGAERDYRFAHIKRVLGVGNMSTNTVAGVNEDEAIKLISRYIDLGLAAILGSSASQTKFAKKLIGEPIAVACCRIINDFAPLEQIIARSFNDGSNREKKAYLIAALASHCYRSGILYDVLSSIVSENNYHVENQVDDEGPLPLTFHDEGDDEFIIPENVAISDSILRRCKIKMPEDILLSFFEIARTIRPYVNLRTISRGDPTCRLASRLFDYDEVVKDFLGLKGAQIFYEEIRQEWKWNSRYWHQVSLMRLDQASEATEGNEKIKLVELAVRHAKHAQTIEPKHAFTLTTLGKVLFGKMQILSKATASDLQDAIQAISQAIKSEKNNNRQSVHPYVVLFSGIKSSFEYVSWSQKIGQGFKVYSTD